MRNQCIFAFTLPFSMYYFSQIKGRKQYGPFFLFIIMNPPSKFLINTQFYKVLLQTEIFIEFSCFMVKPVFFCWPTRCTLWNNSTIATTSLSQDWGSSLCPTPSPCLMWTFYPKVQWSLITNLGPPSCLIVCWEWPGMKN